MLRLGLLLPANDVLHGVITGGFGIEGTEPPAVFRLVYIAPAVVAVRPWAQARLVVMSVTPVGRPGLAVNFKKLQRRPTVQKIMVAIGGGILTCVGALCVVRSRGGRRGAASPRSARGDTARVGVRQPAGPGATARARRARLDPVPQDNDLPSGAVVTPSLSVAPGAPTHSLASLPSPESSLELGLRAPSLPG
jgi:hypothetical protein